MHHDFYLLILNQLSTNKNIANRRPIAISIAMATPNNINAGINISIISDATTRQYNGIKQRPRNLI